jgi:hypothetical protein
MELLNNEIKAELPPLYGQDGKGDDAIAYVKYFTPDGNWTWYATEFDPETGRFFGLVCGFHVEIGYFMLDDLTNSRGALGLPIERDIWFKPTKLGQLKAKHDG